MRQDFLRRSNRNARHPVNAMLNYGYAVLESQVRIAIAESGLDPTIGYLHVCQPGRDSLVYDLMEPYRPKVDREVLAIVSSQTFTPRDFLIDAKGVCRLHPELARRITASQRCCTPPSVERVECALITAQAAASYEMSSQVREVTK